MAAKRTMTDHMGPRHGGLMSSVSVKNRRVILRRLWKYLQTYRLGLIWITFLVAATTGLSLCGPFLIGRAIDKYISHGDLPGLAHVIGLLIVVYLLSAGGTWLQSIGMIRIAQKCVKDIRGDLFGHLQALSLRFFDRNAHGELMSRLTNDTDTISSTLADGVAQLIGSVLSIVGAGIIMFKLNWLLAIACLVTVPFITISTRLMAERTRQGFRARQDSLGQLNGVIEESITGQRVIKTCCHERQAAEDFGRANVDLKRTAVKALIYIGLMGPMMNMYRNIGFAIVTGTGAWMVAKGMTTIGIVAAFINYADYFNRPLIQIANIYGTIQQALAGAERVFAVMDETSSDIDDTDALDTGDVRGEIDFKNVSFGYNEESLVLKDITFHVDAGQTVALVGSTGAGKTTIINLLTRFYDIDKGSISLDGRDIRDLKKSALRTSLGIVLQDTFLFTDTVSENIRYGRPDATDAQVEAAAKFANADPFIHHLPHGYDTLLTDAGGSLSQGQRQLLAIARALLADPAVLILDEATSSVDTRTEIHIQQALHRLMEGRTSFVIAHRLNTIQRADKIIVIENGEVAEQGTHEQLLNKLGPYYRLYTSHIGLVK
ncbi:MAG: ABC transporter ATP-binding protein [Armatimonadota bacterium]